MTVGAPEAVDVAAAYRACETITRQQAKNFAYGIALLPGDKRRALSAVYAFARRIDDIGDGTLPVPEKIAKLAAARESVTALTAATAADAAATGDLVLIALRDAADRFPIPLMAFGELIDGCEADVRGVSYPDFQGLEHYCRCVAGSIGRLSLGVFGCADPGLASPLADSLGVALQLTNILRDIREDLGNGRVYLPAADLARFGCSLTPPSPGGPGGDAAAGERQAGGAADAAPRAGEATTHGEPGSGGAGEIRGPMPDLIRFEADRARRWYETGLQLIPLLDRRSAACTGAMAGIYRRLLEHISARPQDALAARMSLPGREKALIAMTALSGIGRRHVRRAAGDNP